MIILKYKSTYQTKEQSKEVANRLINKLSLFIKNGSVVANEKKKVAESREIFLTTLDLNIYDQVIDFLGVNEILRQLSNNWRWNFSSLLTTKSLVDNSEIRITFIDVVPDKQECSLCVSFYIISSSEFEATENLKTIFKNNPVQYSLLDVSKYFKMDDCYIVSIKIFLQENTIEEIRNILFEFSHEWKFIGLEASTEQCVIDENITEMNVMFREAIL